MNIILNTAAGIFCLLIPATLLASGWNVLAPAAWCWLERGTAAMAGAIATGLLFLFAQSYRELEDKNAQNAQESARAPETDSFTYQTTSPPAKSMQNSAKP